MGDLDHQNDSNGRKRVKEGRSGRLGGAAKAAVWHIAKVERHGDIRQGMWRRVVHAKQVQGREGGAMQGVVQGRRQCILAGW